MVCGASGLVFRVGDMVVFTTFRLCSQKMLACALVLFSTSLLPFSVAAQRQEREIEAYIEAYEEVAPHPIPNPVLRNAPTERKYKAVYTAAEVPDEVIKAYTKKSGERSSAEVKEASRREKALEKKYRKRMSRERGSWWRSRRRGGNWAFSYGWGGPCGWGRQPWRYGSCSTGAWCNDSWYGTGAYNGFFFGYRPPYIAPRGRRRGRHRFW